jgi:hypothetical protein
MFEENEVLSIWHLNLNDGLIYKKCFVGNVLYNLSFAIAVISVFQNKAKVI